MKPKSEKRAERPQKPEDKPSSSGNQPAEEEVSEFFQQKKRKLHTYEKAKLAFDRIKEEKRVKREEFERRQDEKEAAMERYKRDKKAKMKVFYKKNKFGQPKLSAQVGYLLNKIERQVAAEKKSS